MRIGPLLQYFCSSCGKILKEHTTIEFQINQLNEECPGCGALLIDTLQNRRFSPSASHQEQVATHTIYANHTANYKPIEHLSVDFQSAYQLLEDSSIPFAFDINKIDALLTGSPLRSTDS
jgi:hypothetical protein